MDVFDDTRCHDSLLALAGLALLLWWEGSGLDLTLAGW
jgi:hypothetical protein